MQACTWLKTKSLKFAGHCNGAICEGEHFVLLWHPSYGSTGVDRPGRMQGVYQASKIREFSVYYTEISSQCQVAYDYFFIQTWSVFQSILLECYTLLLLLEFLMKTLRMYIKTVLTLEEKLMYSGQSANSPFCLVEINSIKLIKI